VLQYDSVLGKMLPARWFAVSQAKLNKAFTPPPIYFGSLYASRRLLHTLLHTLLHPAVHTLLFTPSSFKAIALCLVYSPFWPPAYLLTAGGLLFSWLCTKLALRYW